MLAGTLGVVIVHPYPLLGGFFNDPVVSAIYRSAVALLSCPFFAANLAVINIAKLLMFLVCMYFRQALAAPDVNTVIKYNQRGVGQSGGSKSIWGYRDCQDLTVICKYLLALQNGPQSIYVVG